MRDAPSALLGAAALVLTAPWGCSYNWSLPDAAGRDATADSASLDASAEADVVTPAEAGIVDAPVDTPVEEAGPNCTSLEMDIQNARTAAVSCMSNTGACMTEVTDECQCKVVVYTDNTAKQDVPRRHRCVRGFGLHPQCPGCISPVQEGCAS